MAFEQRLDIGNRPAAHFLVHSADDPPLHFLVEALLEHPERLGRGDDCQRVEVIAKHALLQLLGGVLDPAVLLLLLEIGFFVSGTVRSEALPDCPRSVGFYFPVLALVSPRIVAFGAKVDLVSIAMVAEEQDLAAVGDEYL